MKLVKNRKSIYAFIAAICIILITNCKDGAGEADYGFPLVYMPQADVNGVNNHYIVPGGDSLSTYNFKVSNGKLDIILGVARAGKISNADGFSVDIKVLPNEANEVIASGEYENPMVLPAEMYQIPNKVTVEKGENIAAFYLSVDINQLNSSEYVEKNLILAVGISNPTNNFELSKTNTSVVVVIDVVEIQKIIKVLLNL